MRRREPAATPEFASAPPTAVVYGLWVAPVPRKLEQHFQRPVCVWLSVDVARIFEDGSIGNLRPLPIWAPPTAWPISEHDRSILALALPFYRQHDRLISSSQARGIPLPDEVLPQVLPLLASCPYLYGEGRRPLEIWPNRPLVQEQVSPWAAASLLEPSGAPLEGPVILLGAEPAWGFVAGAFRPIAPMGEQPAVVLEAPAAEAVAVIHPPTSPRPRLLLSDDGDNLVVKFHLVYESALPISPNDPRRAVAGERQGVWGTWQRDLDGELALCERMGRLGLEPRSNGVYLGYGDVALDFLCDEIPRLLAEGWEVFGLERLHNLRVRRGRIRTRISISSDIDWFELKSELDLDGASISVSALRDAIRGRTRYVRLDSGEYARLPAQWLARQRALSQSLGPDLDGSTNPAQAIVQRLPGYLALVAQELLETADEQLPDARWVEFQQLLSDQYDVPAQAVPTGFVGELRAYQAKGLDLLCFWRDHGLHGILADDMGLGKTIQAIALLQSEIEAGRLGTALLVVPTSVIFNWEKELARFSPGLRTLVLHGPHRRFVLGRVSDVNVVITSYSLLRRDLAVLRAFDWNWLILDEAQNIKNPHSQSARAARSLPARHRLCLTGTPLENHPLELWSLFQFLMPGLLGSEKSFRGEFMGAQECLAPESLARLHQRTHPFILRRLKQEVAPELPPRSEMITYCEFGPEQRRLYNQTLMLVRTGVFAAVDREGVGRSHLHILEALLRLRQICCAPELLLGPDAPAIPSTKVEALLDLLAEIVAQGHRALVFSQFVKVLHILRDRLGATGMATEYLDGQTKDRLERAERFNSGTTPVFLISLKAGGTGLNLTGADYVIHFDPWWNPAVEDQATDRAHRIGQTRHVFSYKLITKDSIEEKVLQLQERKRKLVAGVLAGEEFTRKLSREDVDFLFAPA